MIEVAVKVRTMSDAKQIIDAAMGLSGAEITMQSGAGIDKATLGARGARYAKFGKLLVTEERLNNHGGKVQRINIKATAQNIGKTIAELRNGQWERGTIQSAVKFAILVQDRARARENKNASAKLLAAPPKKAGHQPPLTNGAAAGAL